MLIKIPSIMIFSPGEILIISPTFTSSKERNTPFPSLITFTVLGKFNNSSMLLLAFFLDLFYKNFPIKIKVIIIVTDSK